MLTADEIRIILGLISETFGPGYAEGEIGRLQAKLSIMLQVEIEKEG